MALAAMAAGVLAACSPANESDTGAPPPAASTAPAPSAEAPAAAASTEPKPITLEAKGPDGVALVGDATKGKKVFAQCMSCHSVQEGVNQVGPSLHNIIGRPAGQVAGFNYSPANKNSGITWTEQELYNYLEDPRAKIPGTIMAFVGLKDSQQRADVIAYLKDSAS
jgi:cytochrome c